MKRENGTTYAGDYFFSTMPVRELIRAIGSEAPAEVAEVSEGLIYRDFITVGLLARKLAVTEERRHRHSKITGSIFRSRR